MRLRARSAASCVAVALFLFALLTVPLGARGIDRTVKLTALPQEAQQTIKLIRQGGPFPSARDGVVFGNREGRLPRERRGHYHEYTVPTPGARDRGARRIVTGAGGELYYTHDHYNTFRRIVE